MEEVENCEGVLRDYQKATIQIKLDFGKKELDLATVKAVGAFTKEVKRQGILQAC